MASSDADNPSDPPEQPPSDPAQAGRRHFRSNVLANVGLFVLQTGIGIWYTPYLIAHLGVPVYGLVPLTAQVRITFWFMV